MAGVGISPAAAILPGGNPVSDACDKVTSKAIGAVTDKLGDAASAIGDGIFNKVTAWVADGAVWLVGEIAVLTDKTTTPNLLGKGFLKQYRLMALLAASMAALMLIFAVFEALARGDSGMLWRVFLVNTPLAAIATTAAYVVVQLLVAVCDGMSEVVTQSTGADAEVFFQGFTKAVIGVGGGAGAVGGPQGAAAGAVAVPLFVGFIALVVVAFAAFFVWIELLMRDAAIYITSLFMPFALAASIWPRWASALRRTCELQIVLIFSKFVIVAIVALAASLLANNEGSVEHVLAGASMLLLACFAPFVLYKMVPFAEGAMSAAYGRQSATSGAVRAVELTNSMLMVQRLSRANWAAASGKGGEGGGSPGGGGGGSGGSKSGASPKGGGGGAGAAEAGAAGAGGVAVIGMAASAAKATKAGGERLGSTGEAELAGSEGSNASTGAQGSGSGGESAPRPPGEASGSQGRPGSGAPAGGRPESGAAGQPPPAASPEPTEASGGSSPGSRPQAPRPRADQSGPGAKAGPAA